MENLMGRYRNVSILAAAVFIQLIGLAVQVKRQTESKPTRLIRVWTVTAVTPLEKGLVRIQNGAASLWHNYVYLRGVRRENKSLQDKIQQLQLEQVRLTQDAQQARRLQALLGFKEQFIDKTTAAQVIGGSGSDQSRTIYLDKGSDDGIKLDMPVISSQGIVGKVIQVFAGTSLVLLINDQNSGVGTILERTRLQAVLSGKPGGELSLDNIMPEEDVRPGDQLLTSGGDQIFPKGLPVGTITSVEHGNEFLKIRVRPAAELNRLEEVLVITQKRERTPDVSEAIGLRAADILARRLPSVPDKPAETKPETRGAGEDKTPAQAVTVNQQPHIPAKKEAKAGVIAQPSPTTPIAPKPAAPGAAMTDTVPAAGSSLPPSGQPAVSPVKRPAPAGAGATPKPSQAVAPASAAPKPRVPPTAKPAPNAPPPSGQPDTGDTPH
jgi:rod shape-determining protein MreC